MVNKNLSNTAVKLSKNPLGIIALFVVLVETITGTVTIFSKFDAGLQKYIIWFITLFPVVVLVLFTFLIIYHHTKLYAPSDFTDENNFMNALTQKTFTTKTQDIVEEITKFGNPDDLKLLFKVQGKTWVKSTKALEVPGGCIIQVTTERLQSNGAWQNSEAVTYVPNVKIKQNNDSISLIEVGK